MASEAVAEQVKNLRTEMHILELEHIQDIVALKYAYGTPIMTTLEEMGRPELIDWLTDKTTGLNTVDYELGHALVEAYNKFIISRQNS
jgi:uncharacterized membrane protein YhfC